MKRNLFRKTGLSGMAALFLAFACSLTASAAFQEDIEKAYNTAVQGQDALDGLDVEVEEITVSSLSNISSKKNVKLLVSGIKGSMFSADIQVTTDESSSQSYYRNGYYYFESAAEGKLRRWVSREDMWERINSEIYLDITSNYLLMLYADKDTNGDTIFYFAASQDTLGDYTDKLLDVYSEEGGAYIESLHGTMRTDPDGHVLERVIDLVYTVESGDNRETFSKTAKSTFRQSGEVTVSLPDLSAYKNEDEEIPAATITPLNRTIYTTDDLNVRAAGSLEAAIIGAFPRGSGVTETGYTSDGWIQVQYNGSTGYVWGEYTSLTRPVFTTDQSGTMYATVDVNIRDQYSTEGTILGVLKKGSSIEITGKTDNGWTRVRYNGQRGYISSNYLSWSEPVVENYVSKGFTGGTVVDASYGTLTIQSSSGKTMMFNTTYATMELDDGIQSGDWVTVSYTGSASPYTATEVINNTWHNDRYSYPSEYFSISGIVTGKRGNTLEVACQDGMYRSFDLSEASVETDEGLGAGSYVSVTWKSSTGKETQNIKAVAVA